MALGALYNLGQSILSPILARTAQTQPEPTPPFNPNEPSGITHRRRPDFERMYSSFEPREVGMEAPPVADEAYQMLLNELRNAPVRRNPGALRTLGTGLYSALRTEPDQVQETIDEKGNVKRVIKRGNWNPLDVKEAGEVLYLPHERAMADWETRVKPMQAAATMEKGLEAQRALAQQRYASVGVPAAAESRKTYEMQVRLEQNQQKIDDNRRKIEHTMARQDLSDSEKLAAANIYRQENTRLEAELQRDLQTLRGQQQMQQIGARTEGAIRVRKTVPGGAGVTSQLPTQQIKAQQLKANELAMLNERFGDFISQDPNTGMIEIEPPGKNWLGNPTGPTPQEYEYMVQYVTGKTAADWQAERTKIEGLGKQQTPVAPQSPAPPPTKQPAKPQTQAKAPRQPPMTKVQRNRNTGETRTLYSYDGGKTWTEPR
jgi:hypothetical protein